MSRDANGAVRPWGEVWSYQVVYWGTLPEDRNTAVLTLNYQDAIAPETHFRVPRSLLPPATESLHSDLVDEPGAPVPLSLEVDLTKRSSGDDRIKRVDAHFAWWEDEEDFYEMDAEELEELYSEPRKVSDLLDIKSHADFIALLEGDAAWAQDEMSTVKSFRPRMDVKVADVKPGARKGSHLVTGDERVATVHQLRQRPSADKPIR